MSEYPEEIATFTLELLPTFSGRMIFGVLHQSTFLLVIMSHRLRNHAEITFAIQPASGSSDRLDPLVVGVF